MSSAERRSFYKMSGSGNDFVVVDAISSNPDWLRDPAHIRSVCERRTGVGADGVVFIEQSPAHAFRMVYLNSDGSRASFCGNAALCSVRFAVEKGLVGSASFGFESDAGVIVGRIHPEGLPEVDLPAVTAVTADVEIPLESGEERVGAAVVGVPHAVILCRDAEQIDIAARGPVVRHHPATKGGANVDYISAAGPGEWRMRTYERGVEGETLACGSGAVASAILAGVWSSSALTGGMETTIRTSSGLPLVVRLSTVETSGGLSFQPSLRGEGRIVFSGELV